MTKISQPIDSERFWISALALHIPPSRRADNQRERNGSKSRKIFGHATPASGPIFPPHFSLLDYLRNGSGERISPRKQIRPTYKKFGKMLFLYPGSIRSAEQPRRQQKRNKSGGNPLPRQGPRDQKSLRFLDASSIPKISEILEPLVFPKGSKIFETLEPLGGPQEAFQR